MAKKNRVCRNCGKSYYVCVSCQKVNSWRLVTCSPSCFKDWMYNKDKEEKQEKEIKHKEKNAEEPLIIEETKENIVLESNVINEGVTDVTGLLKSNKKMKINGFDLDSEKFDCADGVTRLGSDFKSFTLTLEEMKEIRDLGKD